VDKKARKDMRGTAEVLQGLIREKTKYFKKRVLQQLNNQSKIEAQHSKEKTLKYSKSLENFQMLQNTPQPHQKQLPKT
jgi:tRNA A22 N-methylase